MDIAKHNREAWNNEVEKGNVWTRPVELNIIEEARKGNLSVLLTPTKPVPKEWFPELRGKKVLCLASGGGHWQDFAIHYYIYLILMNGITITSLL